MRKRLLLISFHFPPSDASGGRRAGIIAKYLPACGWDVHVVSAPCHVERPDWAHVIDADCWNIANSIGQLKSRIFSKNQHDIASNPKLTSGASGSVSSKKRMSLKGLAKSLVFMPGAQPGWLFHVVRKVRRVVRVWKPHVLLSTHEPIEAHIAAALAVRTGIPWVADFRDLWASYHAPEEFFNAFQLTLAKRLERWLVRRATAATTVSEPLAVRLEECHGKSVFSIPTGFDPEDYPTPSVSRNKKFTIVHAGNVWKEREHLFDEFLHALRSLLDDKSIVADNIQVDFYGSLSPAGCERIHSMALDQIVHYRGSQPRSEIIALEQSADLLLILSWSNQYAAGTYTSKVFEYLAAQRPILAIGYPGSVLEELLCETESGAYCSNRSQTAGMLVAHYREWQSDGSPLWRGRADRIAEYAGPRTAEKFAKILEHVCPQSCTAEGLKSGNSKGIAVND